MVDTQLFVIGDVHGCFNTFREMVQQHWRPNDEILVQLGDLIDRGLHSPECISVARSIEERFPGRSVFLKGNHEFEAVRFHETRGNPDWLSQGGAETLSQYKNLRRKIEDDIPWLKSLKVYYETSHVLVSHAGVTETRDPYRESNSRGVLWNRSELRNMGKLQIIGHTPVKGKPQYRQRENVWNIDTGAYKGDALSALRVNTEGRVMDIISIPAVRSDYISDM